MSLLTHEYMTALYIVIPSSFGWESLQNALSESRFMYLVVVSFLLVCNTRPAW